MSPPPSRLPARPSLEQLRKRAKDRLREMRATDPYATLADAQYAVARELGFESWPRLVRHVESVQANGRFDQFERLANDMLAAYDGDAQAIDRLIAHFAVPWSADEFRRRLHERTREFLGNVSGNPTLEDVRAMVAREYGFSSWTALAEALAQQHDVALLARHGHSAAAPFYRIDPDGRTIDVRPPLNDNDWDTIFAVMRERRITEIHTSAMTDSALARLAKLEFVTAVRVSGGSLTDEGLQQLAGMPQLQILELGGRIGDRGLSVLQHLPRLRRIGLGWVPTVTDSGTANLRFCNDIERVDLMGTATGDATLDALRGKKTLRHLTTGRLVTDTGLAMLRDFPAFGTWQGDDGTLDLMTFAPETNNLLLDGPFTDRGLATLAGLAGVFGLGFFWHAHNFTGAGLAALAGLPNLGFLGCQGERCDDAAMRSIATLPKLRMLMGQGAVATDDGFAALSRSPTLEYLWGRDCPNLTGRGFAAMASMPSLRGLGVSCRRVDDAALATLAAFPSLTQLMPMDVSDEGFRHVGACARLTSLWCMYCRDTGDRATEHIAGLTLASYYAGKTRITDRSCEILARMTTLENVELWETAGVTDAGIAALATLPKLRKFTVGGARSVSRDSMALFRNGVRVEYEG